MVNYYGLLFENIFVKLDISTYDNANSSTAAKKLLDRWPHLKASMPALVNASLGNSFVVPNIVHFIWFADNSNREMSFLNYVSILSAYKVQQPDVIMFHCNFLPSGKWWGKLWRTIPLKIVFKEKPREIHGQKIIHTFHMGDIAKMEVLIKYGGIYLDYDVVVVNSLDPLRHYDASLGKEKPPKLIAGIIVACKNSLFLRMVYESYRDNYRPLDWDYNCARVAYKIALERPDLVYIEPRRLTTPDWADRHLLWNEIINWSDLFVIHVMGHFDWSHHTPESIKKQNSTFGQVMRYIYYGNTDLMF